jgi:WhiB family transcriptional regulator, redox-sensing transcriptional regulator
VVTVKIRGRRVDLFFMVNTAVMTDVHWTKMALCAGHPERGCWFPDDYYSAATAKPVAICRVCPVQNECLNFAITTGQSEGIWGGTTPAQRRRIVRNERAQQLG